VTENIAQRLKSQELATSLQPGTRLCCSFFSPLLKESPDVFESLALVMQGTDASPGTA